MNSDKKILICDKIEPEGVDLLKESGFTILENPTITPEELLEVITEVHVVVVRSRTKITESVINSGKILELICRPGTGIDNIDSSTAEKNNIPVYMSYGMTETCSGIAGIWLNQDDDTGYKPHADVTISINKEQIHIKSNTIMKGYMHDKRINSTFKSNDIGNFDKKGLLEIIGRSKFNY